ncbi:MAG: 5'-nucleotidase C-terminal domain-containing protein [Paludibacteraceae bacterium]
MQKYLSSLLIVLAIAGCTPKKWVLTQSESYKIPINSTLDPISDKNMEAFIAPFKKNLDKEMEQVVGYSAQEMKPEKPESLLSNWTADVYLETGIDYLKQPVDMAVVNVGGLRTSIPKGKITVRNIFELMPFENELVLLWLQGNDVDDLIQGFAKEGGQGVSGVRFDIKGGQAENITIQGMPIDFSKIYIVATNDYLAGGNDKMTPLLNAKKRMNTELKIRDVLMVKIIRENKAGEKIESQLDGRIKVL